MHFIAFLNFHMRVWCTQQRTSLSTTNTCKPIDVLQHNSAASVIWLLTHVKSVCRVQDGSFDEWRFVRAVRKQGHRGPELSRSKRVWNLDWSAIVNSKATSLQPPRHKTGTTIHCPGKRCSEQTSHSAADDN